MSKIIDLTGQKFGYWTVIKKDEENNKGGTRWICKCVCGKEKSVDGNTLRKGTSTNCGCIAKENLRKSNTLDLTGQRFGRLVVEKMVGSKVCRDGRHKSQCYCKCDCGNTLIVSSNALKRGNTKSCGCLKTEKAKEFENLVGRVFGRLTVVEYLYEEYNEKPQNYTRYYRCMCSCGKDVIKSDRYLKYADSPSCGCWGHANVVNRAKEVNTKHGMKHSKIYDIWQSMKGRCKYSSVHGYHNYGGRGITVCEEWKKDFINFYNWAMANGYQEGLSIDRIDVNGNYEPNNCRWATAKEQANNRRTNKMVLYNGKTQSLADWCRELNLDYELIRRRARYKKWSIEDIFTRPRRVS